MLCKSHQYTDILHLRAVSSKSGVITQFYTSFLPIVKVCKSHTNAPAAHMPCFAVCISKSTSLQIFKLLLNCLCRILFISCFPLLLYNRYLGSFGVCALQDSDAQLRSAVQTAKSDLDWVIAEVKAGKLTHEEADECIKSVSDSALSVTAALAAVKQAESGGLEDVRDQESAGLRESGWFPTVDESVRLLRLGGKTGKVSLAHTTLTDTSIWLWPFLSVETDTSICHWPVL